MTASLTTRAIRRSLDLCLSTVGLVVMSPVMALIAIAVKRDSSGPALFAQERVGLRGRPFTLLKFRTMRSDINLSGPSVTAGGDPRITHVGAALRSTKLDELPQLVNVARGDMSIVGPRPEVAKYVQLWPSEARDLILSVRPGITDPMTVVLRREEELLSKQDDPELYYRRVLLPEKVRGYEEYVRTRTLLGDLGVLVRTLASVAKK